MSNPYPYDPNRRVQGPGGDPPKDSDGGGCLGCIGLIVIVIFVILYLGKAHSG